MREKEGQGICRLVNKGLNGVLDLSLQPFEGPEVLLGECLLQ
jgi:hypothetical protein